jgi:hypothetical protein
LRDLRNNGTIILKIENEVCTGFDLVSKRPKDGFLSGSIKVVNFLDHLRNYQLLKNNSDPQSWSKTTSAHPALIAIYNKYYTDMGSQVSFKQLKQKFKHVKKLYMFIFNGNS